MRRLIRLWGPAAGLMAIIFVASSTPSSSLPHIGLWDLALKKGGHLLGYGLLSLAYLRGLRRNQPLRPWMLWAALGLASLYGVSDEFHQLFVRGRGASPIDVGIDAIGAGLGLAARVIRQIRTQSPHRSTRPRG